MSRRHVLVAESLSSVFGRVEELVTASSGEDAFEEIFKLLVCKLWDEQHRRTFAAATLDSLFAGACRGWPGLFPDRERLRLPRPTLAACAAALGGVQLGASSGEALDAAFEFLTARASKGKKGQFFTPRHVVDFCVRMIAPRAGETVLDPACGSGAFLVHALEHARVEVRGCDFDPRAARIARVMLLLAGERAPRIACADSLGARLDPADVILTNPPFAGELRERALLDGYRFGRGRARVERDVLFLERAVDLLKPGGRLAIILPHNKFAAEAHADLRRWLVEELRIVAVVGLGRHTFMPHTSQQASVLFARKRTRPRGRAREPIFFALSERDGKTSKGEPIVRAGAGGPSWRRVDHDLDEIHAAWKAAR